MKIVISMPVFNESEGIAEFLSEIRNSLTFDTTYVIVEDASYDETKHVLHDLTNQFSIIVIENLKNMGHGASTIKGLRQSSTLDCDFVLSTDGDGQFYGRDFCKMLQEITTSESKIVEGVRRDRTDPWYRKVPSIVTRLIVFLKSGSFPQDANTPMRIYEKATLVKMLRVIPDELKTPNIFISALVRKNKMSICEIYVASRRRRGKNSVGTMWNSKTEILPSWKFLRFCFSAFFEIITLKVPRI